ncbi:DUF421 domain-containing protein [Bacillus cereus]|uniref:DUF421 domain-containing protein n=1 Tax=Bacillus thuringiensis TaxID=1428 RepID=A0AAW9JD03_BACTU|nr:MULTISPECIES: DUF421 domain-containing protein [Bacillus cereus group]MDA1782667.1 DUF421 domain-containing protein [Bacillus cereus]MDA2579204.1 DUF421 domain-containing protein [Bacillus cereus]MDZ4537957.1 DUF421 domain-containing protein [Bacillus cereus]MDZ5476435.1 DUF421 domain-containing protein [Bacillus thuringiensis]
MSYIWESFVLILAGIFLLRIAGRKSISQMTLAQTVVMISIGTIIVQPIVEKSIIKAIVGAAIFVISVVILEYLQLKSNAFEKFITGKSKIVIENGTLNIQNLKKLRLTVDQLEIRLRNQGISNIKDIKTATLEPNGQLGYELKEDAKPLTVGGFKELMDSYFLKISASDQSVDSSDTTTQQKTSSKPNIFEEIEGQPQQNPKYLR